MSWKDYDETKSKVSDYIRATNKFKTPSNLSEHGQAWYGNNMVFYFDETATDDKIIAYINADGHTSYINFETLKTII